MHIQTQLLTQSIDMKIAEAISSIQKLQVQENLAKH